MRFETTNEEIIEMYNDYIFLKYYHINVVDDIINNTKHLDDISDDIIKSMVNQQEFNQYVVILKKYIDIVYPMKQFGRLICAYNKEIRENIENKRLVDIITDDDMIQTYICELKFQLRRRYLNKDY